MIKNLILLTGVSAFWASSYLLFKVKKLQKVFDSTERVVKMFNIGYLDSLQQLPKDQYILLAGKAQHPQKKSNIIETKTKQTQHLQFISSNYNFSIFSKNNNQVPVSSDTKTLIYNLKQLPNKSGSGLAHDTNVAMFGIYSKNKFTPLVLMGENKDSFLKALDKKIVGLRNKSRNFGILGGLIFAGDAIYKLYTRNQSSS